MIQKKVTKKSYKKVTTANFACCFFCVDCRTEMSVAKVAGLAANQKIVQFVHKTQVRLITSNVTETDLQILV